MADLARFGVSMDPRILKMLDGLVRRRAYGNRSEAVRDLVRAEHVRQVWQAGRRPVVATLTILYDHHVGEIGHRLTGLQHEHGDLVHSTMHVHLSHAMCLEVIVLKGAAGRIRRLSDRLIAARGVKHGQLVATTGEDLA
jgi:CopG family nickel-responsive transcriptional regulator